MGGKDPGGAQNGMGPTGKAGSSGAKGLVPDPSKT